MANKQFNSVDGYSVGNANVVIDSNGNISGNAITATANITAPQIISNVAQGTAPLVVTSTTQVANLNAATAGTVTTAAQPNITSVGTLTSLNVSGNANTGNLGTTTLIATTGNITTINSGLMQNGTSNVAIASGANVTLTVASTARITATSAGANVTGTLDVSGNANVGNLGAAQVLATANVTAPQLISNVATGTAPFVVTSTTQVANLNAATAGTAGSATTAGTVTTAAQPNITSVGTLTSLSVGTITARANGSEGGQIDFNNPDNGNTGAILDVSSADVTRWFTTRNNSLHQIGQLSGTGGTIALYTAASERMRIDSGGNVGIGTSSPFSSSLTNYRSGTVRYVLGDGSQTTDKKYWDMISTGGTLYMRSLADADNNSTSFLTAERGGTGTNWVISAVTLNTAGAERVRVDSSGNVGIGNTVPTDRLSVNGNIVSSGYMISSVSGAVSAAGTVQANSTALTSQINVVSTVASGAGVQLPNTVAGVRITIMNTSANALLVYPPSGETINSLALNAAYSQPAGARLDYVSTSSTQWYTLNATYG